MNNRPRTYELNEEHRIITKEFDTLHQAYEEQRNKYLWRIIAIKNKKKEIIKHLVNQIRNKRSISNLKIYKVIHHRK